MIILNVSGYKTGGTWLQNILNVGTSNFHLMRDTEELKEIDTEKEYFKLPIQFGSLENFKKLNNAISLSKLAGRFDVLEKVHFYSNEGSLVSLLAKSNIRYFIMVRDYRDLIVSRFYHEIASGRVSGDFSEFFTANAKKFLIEAHNYNAFWMKVKQHTPNVHIIDYANLKNDYNNEINKIRVFLDGTNFSCDKVAHLNNIKNNRKFHTDKWMDAFKSAGGDFYRKGIIGDYKNYFSEIQLKEFDTWLTDLKRDHSEK
ncbi:sulfotransferase domain-containing protein [Paraglaciecola sp. 2405UD69-4]|uniref:sulfotransferase domain-containing protein n=1 Tax=Paraglaciecola sp. 2405UD69-4 TaxID=3391836 RepID=UPI0039C993F6